MCNYISLYVYKTLQNTKEGLHGKMHGTPTSNINLFRLSCSYSETHSEFGSTPLHNRIPIRDPDVYHVSLTIANSYWGIDSHASRPLPSTLAALRLLAVHLPAFAPAAYSVHRCRGMGEFGFLSGSGLRRRTRHQLELSKFASVSSLSSLSRVFSSDAFSFDGFCSSVSSLHSFAFSGRTFLFWM